MNIKIRKAVIEDVDSVRFVGISSWPSTYGPLKGPHFVVQGLDTYWNAEVITRSITEGKVYVAEAAQGVVGMTEVADMDDDLVMWKLYLVPSEQGSGIGGALVNAAKEHTIEKNCHLFTEYHPDNSGVHAFYERQGFEPTAPPWPGSQARWLRWNNESALDRN